MREKRRFLWFLASQCVTLFGSTLSQMAVVWYVTMETASGAWVAAFTAASYLPQFLFSFAGGVWADRFNRKWLIAGADGAMAAAAVFGAAALSWLWRRQLLFPFLLALALFRSAGSGIQTPAVNAVIPDLMPKGERLWGNGLNAAMQSAVQFAAPAAAGILFAVGNLKTALLADAATAAVGIALLSAVSIPKPRKSHEEESKKRLDVWSDIKEGLRYAVRRREVGKLLLVYGLLTLLCVPAGFLSGVLVRRTFGSTYWHLTAAELAGFGGMTVGGLAAGLGRRFVRGREKSLLKWGTAVFGLFSAAMGAARHFPLYLVLMGGYGMALTAAQSACVTLLQEKTDEGMMGRVFGLQSSMYAGFLPLGMAVFGPLADVLPLPGLMLGAGIGLAGLALWI